MSQLEIVGILLMIVGDLAPILSAVAIRMSTGNQGTMEGSLIPGPVFLASLGALVGGAILFVLAGDRAVEREESAKTQEELREDSGEDQTQEDTA